MQRLTGEQILRAIERYKFLRTKGMYEYEHHSIEFIMVDVPRALKKHPLPNMFDLVENFSIATGDPGGIIARSRELLVECVDHVAAEDGVPSIFEGIE